MKRAMLVLGLLLAPTLAWADALDPTESLEIVTSAAGSVTYKADYVDVTATTSTGGRVAGSITTATTTSIISAPAASTTRVLKSIRLFNASTTVANTIIVQVDVSATDRLEQEFTLCVRCSASMNNLGDWTLKDANGRVRTSAEETLTLAGSRAFQFLKIGTASEAVAIPYGFAKDTGLPGAQVVGTPGLNGDAVSCEAAADATIAGSPVLPNPATGSWYLTDAATTVTTGHYVELYDWQWYNTGIAITTTTNQAITFPTPVSRDANGAANGAGVGAAIYVLTTLGNGAVTNTTMTYTDQDGNASNTATMASMPATAVAGTFVPFQLAAGDTGVRSIQGITLGTTYVSGTIALVTYKPLLARGNPVANVGSASPINVPGIKIWNGTCFQWRYISSATTATTLNAVIQLTER